MVKTDMQTEVPDEVRDRRVRAAHNEGSVESYLLPEWRLSAEQRFEREQAARELLVEAAMAPGIGIVACPEGLAVRRLTMADLDYGRRWDRIDGQDAHRGEQPYAMRTGPLVAGQPKVLVQTTVPNNAHWVFYGVSVTALDEYGVSIAAILLRFLQGAPGTCLGTYALDSLVGDYGDRKWVSGLLMKPLWFGPCDPCAVEITAGRDVTDELCVLEGYVAEPSGLHVGRQRSL